MRESLPVIYGLSGVTLTPEEAAFFTANPPYGYILFGRNIAGGDQLKHLTASLRALHDDPGIPVFIDQEGGRVQRLRPPLAPNYPAARAIGDLHAVDPAAGLRAAWLFGRLHAHDLARHGINADCLPVLDVPVPGAHDVIGHRAYALEPERVSTLGRASAEGLMAGGLLPVMKHVPGHGRAACDTHMALPTVTTPLAELERADFLPFRQLADLPAAMTAHIVFTAIDADNPVTFSAKAISEIIRGHIGFDGLLMSDDVSMHALSGDFASRARRIIDAGCDIVLHCNGDMAEMNAIAAALSPLAGMSLSRAMRARSGLSASTGEAGEHDLGQDHRAEFESLLGMPLVA